MQPGWLSTKEVSDMNRDYQDEDETMDDSTSHTNYVSINVLYSDVHLYIQICTVYPMPVSYMY
jgi:hypothetical protein